MCSALGLNDLLGAAKRRMLSLAEAAAEAALSPLVMPFVCGAEVLVNGVPLVVGAGMMVVVVDDDGMNE